MRSRRSPRRRRMARGREKKETSRRRIPMTTLFTSLTKTKERTRRRMKTKTMKRTRTFRRAPNTRRYRVGYAGIRRRNQIAK